MFASFIDIENMLVMHVEAHGYPESFSYGQSLLSSKNGGLRAAAVYMMLTLELLVFTFLVMVVIIVIVVVVSRKHVEEYLIRACQLEVEFLRP